MSVRFYLGPKKLKDRTRSVRLVLTQSRDKRVFIALPLRVRERDWSKARERLKPSTEGATVINAELDKIKAEAEAFLLAGDLEAARIALLKRFGRASVDDSPKTLAELNEVFLEHKATMVSESTLQTWRALSRHLQKFFQGATTADVKKTSLEDFQTFLVRQGMENSTVNKLTRRAVSFFRWLERRSFIETVPDAPRLPEARGEVIALRPDELIAFRQVDLSDLPTGYEDARRLFLFCCFTGQRISDVLHLTWDALNLEGRRWTLVEKKTGKISYVPLSSRALALLNPSGTRTPLPRLSPQVGNRYLKEIAKRAGLRRPVQREKRTGGQRESLTLQLWEVISFHVGRKTFISRYSAKGGAINDLLGFTHEDPGVLRQYIAGEYERLSRTIDGLFDEEDRLA